MSAKSTLKGYETEYVNNEWIFTDTQLPTITTYKARPCGNCKKHTIDEGYQEYDNCIGKLQGLMNACCGHGNSNDAYVQFMDGTSIHGEDAIIIQEILKRHRRKIK